MSTSTNELIARFGEAAVQVALPRGEVTLEARAQAHSIKATGLSEQFC